jgi:thiol-disulfide isomerase/thioredoxin
MANIVNIILRNYVDKYKRYIFIAFILVLFVVAAYFGYSWYAQRLLNPDPTSDVANANQRAKPVDILFFYTTWCPHCTKSKPEWDKFVNDYDQKNLNGYVVNCIPVNCDEDGDPSVNAKMQEYSVDHFPTIKMVLDNDKIDFDARVTESNLVAFVNSVTK